MQAGIALNLEPFVFKDNETTMHDWNLYKIRFRAYCSQIRLDPNSANAQHQQSARDHMQLCGGNFLLEKMTAMANYPNVTYTQFELHMDAYFSAGNVKYHESIFLECKPNDNERMVDYVSRLRPLARAANMNTDEQIMRCIRINTVDYKIREKLMENITLVQFIDWANTRDLNLALRAKDENTRQVNAAQAEAQVNRIATRGRANGRGNYSNKRNFEKCARCNRNANNSAHQEANGICPFAQNQRCDACGGTGHFAVVCPNNDQGSTHNKNMSYSFRGRGNQRVVSARPRNPNPPQNNNNNNKTTETIINVLIGEQTK